MTGTTTAAPAPAQPAAQIDVAAIAQAVAEIIAQRPKRQKAETSAENGRKGGRPPAPPHADVADAFVRRYESPAGYTLRHWRGTWRQWRPVEGWREIPQSSLIAEIAEYLRADDRLRWYCTNNYISSVLTNLASTDLCGLPHDLPYPCWLSTRQPANNWISFADGESVNVLEYVRGGGAGGRPQPWMRDDPSVMRPASCDLFSGDYVNYRFGVSPEEMHEWRLGGKWQKYLDRIMPGDTYEQGQIATMYGVCLTDETKWETFWQLFGRGANGKTVCLDVLTALVGRHNVSTVALGGLLETFSAWPLTECKVNITGDMATDVGHGSMAAIEGEFRHAVSGGTSDFQRKHADLFRARHRARWVMATNALPTFIDRSDAIWRRLRIIPFDVQIPEAERDPDTAKKIIHDELPMVLHWALDGLDMPVNLGRVPDDGKGAIVKSTHRKSCDHEQEFLSEKYAKSPDDRVKVIDVYSRYREWCGDNGYRPLGCARFVQRALDVFPSVRHVRCRFDLDSAMGFDGLGEVA